MRLPRAWATPAALVALQWLVTALVASAADGYDRAPWPLLVAQQLVLVPMLVGSAWWIGRRLAGSLFGAIFGLVVVLLPPAGLRFSQARYHDVYVDRVLTSALGLADNERFACLVGLTAASALVLRSLDGDPRTAVAAGLAAGLAALVEPSGVLFLAGAGLCFALARKPKAGAMFAGGLMLPLAAMLVWRTSTPVVEISWGSFSAQMAGLREYLWSNRVLQWLPLAGVIGVARRSIPAAALLGGWFGAFLVVEGASTHVSVTDGSFFLVLLPALPAYSLLAAAVPLLVPTLPARLDERVAVDRP